jgi:hypothetical protein
MAEKRRQEPQGRFKRQGPSLREKARDEFETAATRRRIKARFFLRAHGGDEKEVNFTQDSERS